MLVLLSQVNPWKDLLRNIRLCLLISLCLHGIQTGTLPVTVSHVDEGDVYSIHQLIAYDELAITNDGENIAALELACIESPIAFIPSLVDGDEASNWKMLQAACRERNNPDSTPLLSFLLHYFDPERLALHRALILVQKWSRDVSLIM
jgi:hypothetical protein